MATFLICHGGWAAGWAWKKVRPLLQAAGHDVYTPTYTGLGERAHLASPAVDLDTHIDDVLAVLHYEDLRDVVLVAHSYGGMVATGVADRAVDRIARLIYVDAYVPENGQCVFDLMPAQMRVTHQEATQAHGDGWLISFTHTARGHLTPELPWIAARRRSQPIRTVTQPLLLKTANAGVPRSYIYCTRITPDDRYGPFARRAKSDLTWRYFEIDASHSPHITAPEALVRLFEQCL